MGSASVSPQQRIRNAFERRRETKFTRCGRAPPAEGGIVGSTVTQTRSLLRRIQAPIFGIGLGFSLVACGDGVARPLVPIPEAEGSEGGTGNSPEPAYCDAVASWPVESTDAEQQLLAVIGGLRGFGFACSGERLNPTPPLLTKWELQCAARLHSLDMAERGVVSHENLEGLGPQARIELTGYRASFYGESVARHSIGAGVRDAWGVLEQLQPAPECENLFDPRFDAVGIGYHQGFWTLDFAGP
jgi:uncharacterized protein YkwD